MLLLLLLLTGCAGSLSETMLRFALGPAYRRDERGSS